MLDDETLNRLDLLRRAVYTGTDVKTSEVSF